MKTPKSMTDGVVYSTEQGRMCSACCQPVAGCRCRQNVLPVDSSGVVRVFRETKGRKGKGVTLVQGITLDAESLAQLGKSLRTLCGTGGTVKEGVIELQGDHIARVIEQLNKQGWSVKRIG